MMMQQLGESFFWRREAPATMAVALLGQVLVSAVGGVRTAGKIVEVEAYLARGDAASHAARRQADAAGKGTAALFRGPGTLYVHPMRQWCGVDIVCGPVGEAGSVLIRALEPLIGIEVMVSRLGVVKDDGRLCSGPGKLCKALGITRVLNGSSVLAVRTEVWLTAGAHVPEVEIGQSARVGLGARSAHDLPLRFYIKNSRAVTAGGRLAVGLRAGLR